MTLNEQTYNYIFNEIYTRVLSYSEKPSQFADFLSLQIREIVGARTIIIYTKEGKDSLKLFSIYPGRRGEWANQDDVLKLAELSFNINKIKFIQKEKRDKAGNLLRKLSINNSIVIPLIVANTKIGSILLFDIMDLFSIDSVIDLFKRLSGVFALVIRNSLLYYNLEETVTLRTLELEKRNKELIKSKLELQSLNKKLKEKVDQIQEINIQLEEAKEDAQESDRLKTVFLQNVSHEIRTPMNSIIGFAEVLPNNFNNKEKLRKFSEIIKNRGEDLLEIIDQILDLSRIETGQMPVNYEECNLGVLFGELHEMFLSQRNKLKKENIAIKFTLLSDKKYQYISTDKGKLRQIFINLINNALKYTDQGEIEFGCIKDKQGNIKYFVSDTGVGIPKHKQNIIFDRFIQLQSDKTKSIEGAGLGLSIVKGLIEFLGGNISIQSAKGKGSKFYFSIPYNILQSVKKEQVESGVEPELDWSSYSVLIVEDNVYSYELMKEILYKTGIQINLAKCAEESIEIIKSGRHIDIILMDVKLPGMDGFEATTILKELNPKIKVIAQTAYATSIDRKYALSVGCDDFITKPIYRKKLLLMMNGHLNKNHRAI